MAENRVTTEFVNAFIAGEDSLARVTAEFVNVFVADADPPPIITSISGTGVVNTPLTITGDDFGALQSDYNGTVSIVDFASASFSPAIVSWSNTEIVVTVPATITSGLATITVSHDGGSDNETYELSNPSVALQVALRDIAARVTVKRRPPGGGAVISQQSLVDGVSIDYTATGDEWSVVWTLSDAVTDVFWTLDDAEDSLLGTTTRIGF